MAPFLMLPALELKQLFVRRAKVANLVAVVAGAGVFVSAEVSGFRLMQRFFSDPFSIGCFMLATLGLAPIWSVCVEEQFYIVTPLLMLFACRVLPKRYRLLFAAIAVVSFVAALAMSTRNTTFAFYLTPFRAWELALGALLAIGFIPAPGGEFGKNACGAAGMLLLLGVICFGSASAPLLLMTSLASIGATLVIASSESGVSTVGRLLSWLPVVFVGLISYVEQ